MLKHVSTGVHSSFLYSQENLEIRSPATHTRHKDKHAVGSTAPSAGSQQWTRHHHQGAPKPQRSEISQAGFRLHDIQKKAASFPVTNLGSVVTWGPGSGRTQESTKRGDGLCIAATVVAGVRAKPGSELSKPPRATQTCPRHAPKATQAGNLETWRNSKFKSKRQVLLVRNACSPKHGGGRWRLESLCD